MEFCNYCGQSAEVGTICRECLTNPNLNWCRMCGMNPAHPETGAYDVCLDCYRELDYEIITNTED